MRDRNRHLMVVNPRYLVSAWVRSKFLASPTLALAARRLADGWERLHGYRSVLCGTFVDGTRFRASCYRGAGWERIGETSHKGVHMPPLRGERDGAAPKPPTRAERGRPVASDRRFGVSD